MSIGFMELIIIFVLILNFLNTTIIVFYWDLDEPIIVINTTVPKLFNNKNWFGILLGVLTCLLFSPSLLIALIKFISIKAMEFIDKICEMILDLGNK